VGENQFLVDTDILIAYLNRRSYRSYLENSLNRIYYSAITKKEASLKAGAKGFGTAGHIKPSPSISSRSD
jgi:predicted nucleic acid-binding protein